jgi:hypothetical protein
VSYNIGDAVPLVYTINAVATVVLTVTDPDGVTSTPSTTQGGSGTQITYTANVAVTKAGLWLYRFVATGTVNDAEDGQFQVIPLATTNVYTTRPELKAGLGIPQTDTVDDDDLDDAILTASRTVDGDCQRHFYKITETRTLTPTDPWCVRLGPYMDLISVTTLKTDSSGDGTFETTWATTDYQLLCADGTPNVNAGPEPRPYRRIKAIGTQTFPCAWQGRLSRSDLVQLNGTWGWPSAVPDRIRRATRLAAAEIFKLNSAPFGAVGMADLGIIRVRDNPKYQRLIADYRIMPVPVA